LIERLRGERVQRPRVAEPMLLLLQGRVQELPAGIGRNARLRHTELKASQPQLGVGAEGTLILQLEAAGARGQRKLRVPRDADIITPFRDHPWTGEPPGKPYRAA